MKVPPLGITVANQIDKPEGVSVEFTVNELGHLCCKAKFQFFSQINADDAEAVLTAQNGADYMGLMARDAIKYLLEGVRKSVGLERTELDGDLESMGMGVHSNGD